MHFSAQRVRRPFLTVALVLSLVLGLAACIPAPESQVVAPPPAQTQPTTPSTLPPTPSAPATTPTTPAPSMLPSTAPQPSVNGDLIARFLDVGQGDAIFISLPDSTSMLIDAGPKSAGHEVVATIKDLGVKRLDYVVFTHPHEDHVGGAIAVLEAFDIGEVIMPRTSHTTQTYEDLLDTLVDKDLTVTEARAGKVIIDKPSLRAWLVGPVRDFEDLNDMSAVLALKYGEITFLFEGDAEAEAEGAMALSSSVQLPEVDVLKVAHHGSSSSSTADFLAVVSPTVAVISCGAGNAYGHPTEEALVRLASVGAKIYRTDQNGTITVTTDGSTLGVEPEKEPAPVAAAPVVPVTPTTSQSDVTVYITKTGEKYHRDGCRYLRQSKIPVSLKDAKANGFDPCSVCKPPT
ncbi:MAG: ComEC/Rec2 family competence protein [Bacillota bacterium]